MAIKLEKEQIDDAVASVREFMEEEFDLELGELKARHMIDFFMQELGPLAYNRGVRDAEDFMRLRVEDLAGSCHEDEFTYWTKKDKR